MKMAVTKEMVSYDVFKFNPKPSSELLCAICHCVLFKPRMCPCHHIFCKTCIETWLNRSSTCPTCRSYTTLPFLQLAPPLVQNVLNSLTMDCDYKDKGCEDKVPMESFPSHLETCNYRATQCPNPGCGMETTVGDLPCHQQECKHRSLQCGQRCQLHLPAYLLDTHDCVSTLKDRVQELDGIILKYQMFLSWVRQKLNNVHLPHQSMGVQLKAFRDMLEDVNKYWQPEQPVPINLCGDYSVSSACTTDSIINTAEGPVGQGEAHADVSILERLVAEASLPQQQRVFDPHLPEGVNGPTSHVVHEHVARGVVREEEVAVDGMFAELPNTPASPDRSVALASPPRSPPRIPSSYNASQGEPYPPPHHSYYTRRSTRFGYSQTLSPQGNDEAAGTSPHHSRSVYNGRSYQSDESSDSIRTYYGHVEGYATRPTHSPLPPLTYSPVYQHSPSTHEAADHSEQHGNEDILFWGYPRRGSSSRQTHPRHYSRSRSRSYSPVDRHSRSRHSPSPRRSYSPMRRRRSDSYSHSGSYSRDREDSRSRSRTPSSENSSHGGHSRSRTPHSPRLQRGRSGSGSWSRSISVSRSSSRSFSTSSLTLTQDDSLNDNGEWIDCDQLQYQSSEERTDWTQSGWEWENSNDAEYDPHHLESDERRASPHGSADSESYVDESEEYNEGSVSVPGQSSSQHNGYPDTTSTDYPCSSSDVLRPNTPSLQRKGRGEMTDSSYWTTGMSSHLSMSPSQHGELCGFQQSPGHSHVDRGGSELSSMGDQQESHFSSQAESGSRGESFSPQHHRAGRFQGRGESFALYADPNQPMHEDRKTGTTTYFNPHPNPTLCSTATVTSPFLGHSISPHKGRGVEVHRQGTVYPGGASTEGQTEGVRQETSSSQAHSVYSQTGQDDGASSSERHLTPVSRPEKRSSTREKTRKKCADQTSAWDNSSEATSLDYDRPEEEAEAAQDSHLTEDVVDNRTAGKAREVKPKLEKDSRKEQNRNGEETAATVAGCSSLRDSHNVGKKGKGKGGSRSKGKGKFQLKRKRKSLSTDSDSVGETKTKKYKAKTKLHSSDPTSGRHESHSKQSGDKEEDVSGVSAPSTSCSAIQPKDKDKSKNKASMPQKVSASNRKSPSTKPQDSKEKDSADRETKSNKRKAYASKLLKPSKKTYRDKRSHCWEKNQTFHSSTASHVENSDSTLNNLSTHSSGLVSVPSEQAGTSRAGEDVYASYQQRSEGTQRSQDVRTEVPREPSDGPENRDLVQNGAAWNRGEPKSDNREGQRPGNQEGQRSSNREGQRSSDREGLRPENREGPRSVNSGRSSQSRGSGFAARRDRGSARHHRSAERTVRTEGPAPTQTTRVQGTETGTRRQSSRQNTRTVVIADVPVPPSSLELLTRAMDSDDSSDTTWTPSSSKSESSSAL